MRKVVHTPDGALLRPMERRAAHRPCAGAHGPAGGPRRPGRAAALAEELTAAVVQMYGAGLERIVELSRTRRRRDAARRRRAGREPAADPRPLSRAARGAGDGRRSTRVRPYMESHGGERRAAGHRGRGRAAAPRGQLQVVPGLVVDARAGGAAGARGGGARPARDGRRGGRGGGGRERGITRRRRCRSCVNGARRRGTTLDDRRPARGTASADGRRRDAARGGQRGRHAARLPRRVRDCGGAAGRRRARRRARCAARAAAAAYFLPQAGRSMDDEQLQLEPVPLLREAGGDQGGAVKPLDRGRRPSRRRALMVVGPARARAAEAAGRPRAPTGGALRPLRHDRARATTATCSTSTSARSSACARAAGRCARATPSSARPAAARLARGLRAARRALGAVPDPDRARVLHALERHGLRRRAVPEPGGRHRERAALRDLEPARRSSTRCCGELEPDAEALIVNRMAEPHAYAIAPIDRCYMLVGLVKASLGGHLRRRRRGAGDRGLLRGAAERWRREPAGDRSTVAGRRPSPSSRCSAPRGRRHAAAPALDFDVHVTEPSGAPGLRDRAHGADHDRAGAARATTPRRASGWSSCSAPPERWATTTRSLCGTRPTRWCPALHRRRPRSAWRCRRRFDLEVAARSTSTGCPDGEVPLAFNFNGTVHYRGDDGRLQMSLVPWAARPSSGCRWRPGAT